MKLASPYEEVSIEVLAPPERVWSLIADVTQMGRWSPVCWKCEWIGDDSGPRVGARFIGHNKEGPARWSRECEVTVCDPGRAFGFSTFFRGHESTRWLYRFEPSPIGSTDPTDPTDPTETGGTKVIEAYEPVSEPTWIKVFTMIPGVQSRLDRNHREGMKETLSRVKRAAEEAS